MKMAKINQFLFHYQVLNTYDIKILKIILITLNVIISYLIIDYNMLIQLIIIIIE